jgi:hypothetical protein
MQPSLALTYASTPAESSLGVGFTIAGLSSISRCDQIPAIDGQRRGVSLDDDDRICLDGARLLAVDGADMQPGTAYRTEVETWRRVETLSSDLGGVAGPTSFLVRLSDGRERLYGASDDSRLVVTRPDGMRAVATWHLTQERDPCGNAIRYEYEHITPTLPVALAEATEVDPPVHDLVRVARIDYTGTANTEGTARVRGSRSIRFQYAETPRLADVGIPLDDGLIETPGPEDGFFVGSYGWRASTFPLERIRTFVDEELVHELRLQGEDDDATRRFRLTRAQLCANAPPEAGTSLDDGLVCSPATWFRWRREPIPSDAVRDPRYGHPTFEVIPVDVAPTPVEEMTECTPSGGRCRTLTPFIALDADGDGTDDVIYWSSVFDPTAPGRRRETLVLRRSEYVEGDSSSPFGAPLGVLMVSSTG